MKVKKILVLVVLFVITASTSVFAAENSFYVDISPSKPKVVVNADKSDFVQIDAGDTNNFTTDSGSSGGGFSAGGFSISGMGILGIPLIILAVIIRVIKQKKSKGRTNNGSGNNYNNNNGADLLSGLAAGLIGGTTANLIGTILNGDNLGNGAVGSTDESPEIGRLIQEFQTKDPGFSPDNFLAHATDLWIKMQIAWSSNDLDGLRGVESKSLYSAHSAQIQALINDNWFNKIERPIITGSRIINMRNDQDFQYITIDAQTRMIDYVIDAYGAVKKGSRETQIFPRYIIEFCRSANAVTLGAESNATVNCPKCGAPTTVVTSGTCEYCSFVITVADSDWTLNKIKRIGG